MILITGSKGLIGYHLKKQFDVLGIPWLGIDVGYTTNHSEYGDIQDLELLKKLAAKVSGIVHLAAVSRVITGEKDPELCWNINVLGTRHILEAARASATKPWVIYASSREVYGQQKKLPVAEEATLAPINVYAQSKVAAEQLIMEYRENGLQTAILRFSNVYGSIDDHADRVIPAFCRVAAQGGTIRIDGGENTFDFTHIEDVVDGIIKVIDKLDRGSHDFQTTHFTSGQPTTLLKAAEVAKSVSKNRVNFVEAPSRSFDVSTFYGDTAHAFRTLGWKTKTGIVEGISQLVKQFELKFSRDHFTGL